MANINDLYAHQMELFYWTLIMMGLCSGLLCGVLVWCAQHLAEFKREESQPCAVEILVLNRMPVLSLQGPSQPLWNRRGIPMLQ